MAIQRAYLERLAAGATFGLYMAHLLYLLNPQISATPARLALATLVYGLICGLLFGSMLWGLRLMRVRLSGKAGAITDRPRGFGFVVLAAFLCATIYWLHVNVLRTPGYLPIGALRVLSKATIVITSTAFALLLLWLTERSTTGRVSRAMFVVGVILIGISSLFLYERRYRYRPDQRSVVIADLGSIAGQRPVIVVAIRNLPYDWIVTLAGEGNLPFFDRARQTAYFTRLQPFPTSSDRPLWASLATGKLPYQHGVTGRSYRTALSGTDPAERFLLLPRGVGFVLWGLIPPVRRLTSHGPAGDSLPFWTMFESIGLRAAVINWLWSEPGGATRVITNDFFSAADPQKEARPESFATIAKSLQKLPPAVSRQRFSGDRNDRLLRGLSHDLAATAIGRLSADDPAFGLTVIALDGFADAQKGLHVFSNDLDPRNSTKGENVRSYVQQLDHMLDSLAQQFPHHLLIVVSPSGPVPPPLPVSPWQLARAAIMPTDPGANDGFFLIAGDGVAHKENPATASATDLAPTVLFAAGLPIGRDMDGAVLPDAFSEDFLRSNALKAIQTYEAHQVVVRRGGV